MPLTLLVIPNRLLRLWLADDRLTIFLLGVRLLTAAPRPLTSRKRFLTTLLRIRLGRLLSRLIWLRVCLSRLRGRLTRPRLALVPGVAAFVPRK